MQAWEQGSSLKEKSKIKDIILLRRSDKNNRIYGYIVMEFEEDAKEPIKAANGTHLGD